MLQWPTADQKELLKGWYHGYNELKDREWLLLESQWQMRRFNQLRQFFLHSLETAATRINNTEDSMAANQEDGKAVHETEQMTMEDGADTEGSDELSESTETPEEEGLRLQAEIQYLQKVLATAKDMVGQFTQ